MSADLDDLAAHDPHDLLLGSSFLFIYLCIICQQVAHSTKVGGKKKQIEMENLLAENLVYQLLSKWPKIRIHMWLYSKNNLE